MNAITSVYCSISCTIICIICKVSFVHYEKWVIQKMLNNKILEHILVIHQTIFPPKEVSSLKEEKVNFAKNRSFKHFITNRKKRNWAIICNILLVIFMWMGTIFHFLHSEGSTLVREASSKLIFNGVKIESTHIFLTFE